MTLTADGSSLREAMSDHSDEPRYVDSVAAGRILGLAAVTVRRAAKAGTLPAVRIGGAWRFLVEDLRNLPHHPPPTAEPDPPAE